jgi:outer membrane immunogenic protein
MRRVLLVTTAFGMLAATTAAMAADLPRRYEMPIKAPAYVPAFSWTGFYIGINGGGAFGHSNWNFAGLRSGFDTSGGLVGGTIGANYQAGSWVFGIEGDGDWTDISGSTSCLLAIPCRTKNDWLATARGRIGWAFDRVLPYFTGGGAFGNIKAGVPGFTEINTDRSGWTVGGGLEYAFLPNWTTKIEYLYVDLGRTECTFACSGGVVPTTVDFTTNIVRAGLNYKF